MRCASGMGGQESLIMSFDFTQSWGCSDAHFQVTDFYNQIQNFSSPTLTGLLTQVDQFYKTTYRNGQASIFNSRISQAEKEAHAVSDPIDPQYIYQWCNGSGTKE